MKVLIVDDEKIVRKGIVSILQQAFPDMQTIAELSLIHISEPTRPY